MTITQLANTIVQANPALRKSVAGICSLLSRRVIDANNNVVISGDSVSTDVVNAIVADPAALAKLANALAGANQ